MNWNVVISHRPIHLAHDYELAAPTMDTSITVPGQTLTGTLLLSYGLGGISWRIAARLQHAATTRVRRPGGLRERRGLLVLLLVLLLRLLLGLLLSMLLLLVLLWTLPLVTHKQRQQQTVRQ